MYTKNKDAKGDKNRHAKNKNAKDGEKMETFGNLINHTKALLKNAVCLLEKKIGTESQI